MQSFARIPKFIIFSLLFFLTACQPETSLPITSSSWDEFGQIVIDAGKRMDSDYLVRDLSFNTTSFKWLRNELCTGPNLEYITTCQEPTEFDILANSTADVELLFRSYDNLFSGEIARVTISERHFRQKVESRAVVIWVNYNNKYYGLSIAQAIMTPWGIKVAYWTGHRWNVYKGSPLTMTADLVVDKFEDCVYPKYYTFTYQWDQSFP